MSKYDYAAQVMGDLQRSAPGRGDQFLTRSSGLFEAKSNFDRFDEINPFVGMSSNPEGTRVHRCVNKVKGKSGVNPYAVCQASTRQSYKTGKNL